MKVEGRTGEKRIRDGKMQGRKIAVEKWEVERGWDGQKRLDCKVERREGMGKEEVPLFFL